MVEPGWLAPVSGADGLEGIWLAHCSQLPPSQHLRRNGTLRFERCARGIFSAQLLEFARLDQASVGSAETEQMDGTKRWGRWMAKWRDHRNLPVETWRQVLLGLSCMQDSADHQIVCICLSGKCERKAFRDVRKLKANIQGSGSS